LETVWRGIIAVAAPTPPALPSPAAIHVKPRPLPPKEISAMGFFKRIVGALFVSTFGESEEKQKRRLALAAAEKRWQDVIHQWTSETGDFRFRLRRIELQRLRDDYKMLDAEQKTARQALRNTVRDRQLHRYLDGFIIEDKTIPQIGPGRRDILRSFGIETAADIDETKIDRTKIPGFGPSLTAQILDWRRDLERKFVFDPSKGVDQADVYALDHRFRQRCQHLEGQLLAGMESLNALRTEALARARALKPMVDHAARCLAQAKADFSIA
jgi:DNA-binding helix-hairpin-helix protein with protein kinase domain